MALSTCVKCGKGIFELSKNTPNKSAFWYQFIQCASCGGVVGVVDGYNIGAKLQLQDEALRQIAKHVGATVNLPND